MKIYKTYKVKYNNNAIKYFNSKDFSTLLFFLYNVKTSIQNGIILIEETNNIPKNKYVTTI